MIADIWRKLFAPKPLTALREGPKQPQITTETRSLAQNLLQTHEWKALAEFREYLAAGALWRLQTGEEHEKNQGRLEGVQAFENYLNWLANWEFAETNLDEYERRSREFYDRQARY